MHEWYEPIVWYILQVIISIKALKWQKIDIVWPYLLPLT